MNKIKKIFFGGVFGVIYISFVAQLVYVIGWASGFDQIAIGLGLLSVEWLVIVAARYLSKKSSSGSRPEFRRDFRR
jgi:hypothetical protein